MASSYVNNLRLNEMATGDASGTWGTITNTNLELIGEALGFGTEAITTNADTHTTTVADGASDVGRAIYLKYTGTLDSACTITIAPNDMKRLQFIENGTSGSQNIIISQGSGANVTITPGTTKAVYLDGAGSGAAVVDAFAHIAAVDLTVDDDLIIGDDLTFSSDSAVITFGADGDTTLTHTDGSGLTLNSTNKIMFNDASQFIQGSSATVLSLGATDEIDLTATAIDVNGTMDVSGTLNVTGETTLATHLNLGDGDKIKLGDSADLQIYHDGSHSYVQDNGSGNIRIKGANIEIVDNDDGGSLLQAVQGGAVTLYNNNSAKLDTTTTGIFVHGNITLGDSHFIGDQTNDNLLIQSSGAENIEYNSGNGSHLFFKNASEVARISDDGNLLVGRTSVLTDFGDGRTSLVLQGTGSQDYATIQMGNNGTASDTQILGILAFYDGTNNNARVQSIRNDATDSAHLHFSTRANGGSLTEQMRIDSTGKVGIGTQTPSSFGTNTSDLVVGTTSGEHGMTIASGTGNGGRIQFADNTASPFRGAFEYDHSSDGMIIYTAGSERMRLHSDGNISIGKSAANNSTAGTAFFGVDGMSVVRSGATVQIINRLSDDGTLVAFRQANGEEGTISVSGSTVSYNGFSGLHESSGISTDTPIGTVVSTIDELDVYFAKQGEGDSEEDNPKAGQTRADHAKVKVSDTVGDKAVYGVVGNFNSQGKVNVASVGIGSVRVTDACEKGDLLESNGDGTAKVQSDDIVRSKTIGKVTIGNSSTDVKLVSCVLYCG